MLIEDLFALPETEVVKKAEGKAFDADLQAVVAATRTAYQLNRGRVPTVEQIHAYCDRSKKVVQDVIQKDEFMAAMARSGINWQRYKGLSAAQNYALMIVTDANDRRGFLSRLKAAGITTTQWRGWLKQPVFASCLKELTGVALQEHETAANNALMKKVEAGDVNAIKFYYEMTGIYNPAKQQDRDVMEVLSAVIEIISRRVKDPATQFAIAEELQGLIGKRPVAGTTIVRELGAVADDADQYTKTWVSKTYTGDLGTSERSDGSE